MSTETISNETMSNEIISNKTISTEKLFQKDVYMTECSATVTKVTERNGKKLICLDRTVFFPTGGGQSCDNGIIKKACVENSEFNVTDVYEYDGEIFHEIAVLSDTMLSENDNAVSSLAVGDNVVCKIDWERRFDNMQRHCGEHIMSGVFFREYGGVNRGFHMGDNYMTVDISLEENPDYKEVTWEMAMHVQDCVNDIIWANLPVTARHFKTRAEAENLPLRKKLSIESDITIVCVGNEQDPADCVACCGTHPAFSGQVGLIKILKVEPNKGMYRIYLEAGKRAMNKFNSNYDLLLTLGERYSAGENDLLQKIDAHEDKNNKLKDELKTIRNSLIQSRTEKILSDITENPDKSYFSYNYDDLKSSDIMNMGKSFAGKTSAMIIITSVSENTVMLFSDGTLDCGKTVKDLASLYGGKGGGKPVSARAKFPDKKSIDSFLKAIECE